MVSVNLTLAFSFKIPNPMFIEDDYLIVDLINQGFTVRKVKTQEHQQSSRQVARYQSDVPENTLTNLIAEHDLTRYVLEIVVL